MAARAAARNEPAHTPPEVELAFLMDRFGTLPGMDWQTLMWAPRILRTYRIYQLAGTNRQKELSRADWELIKMLDEEASG